MADDDGPASPGGSEPPAGAAAETVNSGTGITQRDPNKVRKLDLFAAILLGLAATLTAFAAFRSSVSSDKILKNYSESAEAIAQANDSFSEADQRSSFEQSIFLEFLVQSRSADADSPQAEEELALANYIYDFIMTPDLQAAVDWWLDEPDETSPPTPFDEANPEYANLASQQLYAEGNALYADAEVKRKAAEDWDLQSDMFDLSTVFLAVTLFLAGIATLLAPESIQRSMLIMSVVSLILGTGVLIYAELL